MSSLAPERQATRFSDTDNVYFRPGIKVEPLLHHWPAWPHLLAPLQHGLNIAFRQLPIMKSFLSNPSVHIAACRNPAMAGGPFVDLPATMGGSIRTLMDSMHETCGDLIALAQDYVEFDRRLQAQASGFSLDGLYDELPASLRGLVELFYDVNGHPKMRIYERLLADLELNSRVQQIYVGPLADDVRPFFMSNPRPLEGEGIILDLAFRDPRVDLISAAQVEGVRFGDLLTVAPPDPTRRSKLESFLTSDRPRRSPTRSAPGRPRDLRVRYFGHATVLLETDDLAVLIDPVLAWDACDADGRFTFHDLPDRLDYVLISHGHHDHFCAEALLQLRRKTGAVIVPANNAGSVTDPSMRLMLQQLGFQDARQLEPLESLPLADGRVVSIPFPGEHADLDIYSKQGLVVEIGQKRLMFLVDSNAVDLQLYSRLAAKFGQIDALFLGMECHGAPLSWLYGPLLSQPMTRKNDESRRLSASLAERAWEVVAEIGPKQVFLYAMGQEPFLSHLTGLAYDEDSFQLREARKFVSFCDVNGVPVTHLCGSRELEI